MSDDDVLIDGRPLSSLKVAELKEELESRNLSTKGVKAVLQDRLREALVAQGLDPVVDAQNPVVAEYLARQSAALDKARKRTESEVSGADTPQSELSPVKKSETSPSKKTPRKSQRVSNAEQEAEVEPEKPKEVETEAEAPAESSKNGNESSDRMEGGAEEVKMDEEKPVEVVTAPPQTAEKVEKVEEPKPVESIQESPEEKEQVTEKPKQVEKDEDDSDELDYGDDEEKEQKEESMETDETEKKEGEKEKTENEKDEGVKKEEKVRGSVSDRRASSPSSRHPVSSIVHIRGLTRPFTERMLRNEIEKHGGEIVDFWIDKVKSHCFAKLTTEDGANKVMKAMHDKVWPDGNPKKLAIVFDTEDNLTRYKEGRGEVKMPEVVTIGTLTGASRAERLSSTSQTSVLGGKASLQITLQNVMRENDKLDLERKEKRGSLASRLTRIDDKEKKEVVVKEIVKEDRKRGRSETPPFSKGAGFMEEKRLKREEREKDRSSKRDEPRREEQERHIIVEEEPQLKTPDQLFKKTSAVPNLYYLPLTEEQIAAKAIKKPVVEAEKEKEKVAERSAEKPARAERSERAERDRGDRAERGGDRNRDRERDHGRDRDRPRR